MKVVVEDSFAVLHDVMEALAPHRAIFYTMDYGNTAVVKVRVLCGNTPVQASGDVPYIMWNAQDLSLTETEFLSHFPTARKANIADIAY